MVAEVRDDYPNETAALQAVADKLGIGSRENTAKLAEAAGNRRGDPAGQGCVVQRICPG